MLIAAEALRQLGQDALAYEAYARVSEESRSKREKRAAARFMKVLAKRIGEVRVSVSPEGANVLIDGRSTAGRDTIKLGVGPHTARAELDGYVPDEVRFEVAAGATAEIRLALRPARRVGTLTVRVDGATSAEVSIEGQPSGPAPWSGELEVGDYAVTVRGAAGESVLQVSVFEGVHSEIEVPLIPSSGALIVPALPDEAVHIDGKLVGQGPWEGPADPGLHEVRLVRPTGDTRTALIFVVAGQSGRPILPDPKPVAPVPPTPLQQAATEPQEETEPAGEFEDDGWYIALGLAGLIPVSGRVEIACSDVVNDCDESVPAGAALALRFGRAVGPIQIEAVVQGDADYSSGDNDGFQGTTSVAEEFQYVRAGGLGGLGLRWTPGERMARFTLGIAGGYAARLVRVRRRVETSSVETEIDNEFYSAPAGTFDLGVLIALTDTVALTIAAVGQMEFTAQPIEFDLGPRLRDNGTQRIDSMPVQEGRQIWAGLQMGVHFAL
jgi:hypothetical protein